MTDLKQIKYLIFDIDGVFTNNEILITEQGELLRSMNVKDGYAVKRLLNAGYEIAVITGGNSEGVVKRLEGLGIKTIFSGVQNKIEVYNQLVGSRGWDPDHILYMGDDIPDIDCLKASGVAICPSDAVEEVKSISNIITDRSGGKGAVREIAEAILKSTNQWM